MLRQHISLLKDAVAKPELSLAEPGRISLSVVRETSAWLIAHLPSLLRLPPRNFQLAGHRQTQTEKSQSYGSGLIR